MMVRLPKHAIGQQAFYRLRNRQFVLEPACSPGPHCNCSCAKFARMREHEDRLASTCQQPGQDEADVATLRGADLPIPPDPALKN